MCNASVREVRLQGGVFFYVEVVVAFKVIVCAIFPLSYMKLTHREVSAA
jgi:hypothetical protein